MKLPAEMIAEIASHLDNPADVARFRHVCRHFYDGSKGVFCKAIVNGRTIYPRYEQFRDFILLLCANPVLPIHVRNIVLVGEGLMEHEYGYEWAWEALQDQENVEFTNKDMEIINCIINEHASDVFADGSFLTAGGYRIMLSKSIAVFF